jgi:dephospho-CoA kinase
MSQHYPHLYLVGLTGNIGCGKSTVSALLAEQGAAVSDADQVTRQVMQPAQPAYDAIVQTWGTKILTEPGGPIDRQALGRIVFADPSALRQLEAIVHPATRRANEQWLAEQDAIAYAAHRRGLVVLEAIKLIENEYPAICDAVWVVRCDEHEQVRRLVESRGMTLEDARQRIAAQPPQQEKVAVADVVIDNSGTLEETREQVMAALQAIRSGFEV